MLREAWLGRRWLLGALVLLVAVVGATSYLLWGPRSPTAEAPASSLSAVRLVPVQAPAAGARRTLEPKPVPTPVQVGQNHRWEVSIRDASGAPVRGCRLTFDADMPEHGHGLPTAPRATGELAPGRYGVEGVRFSMPGRWELVVTTQECGADATYRFVLTL